MSRISPSYLAPLTYAVTVRRNCGKVSSIASRYSAQTLISTFYGSNTNPDCRRGFVDKAILSNSWRPCRRYSCLIVKPGETCVCSRAPFASAHREMPGFSRTWNGGEWREPRSPEARRRAFPTVSQIDSFAQGPLLRYHTGIARKEHPKL
jgi:hypothetical protein